MRSALILILLTIVSISAEYIDDENDAIVLQGNFSYYYSASRLIGSRIIESAAYCNQKLLALLYLNSTQISSVNWIILLLLSLLGWAKVILLSGGHCN
jgi:hypothetical protein